MGGDVEGLQQGDTHLFHHLEVPLPLSVHHLSLGHPKLALL